MRETLTAFKARMELLTAEQQIVEFDLIRDRGMPYPVESIFGRFLDDESTAHAGNVSGTDFPTKLKAGQVWVIDNFGVLNGSGGALGLSGTLVFNGVSHSFDIDRTALDNNQHESLLVQPLYIDQQVASTLIGGGATEVVTIHARRIL